LYFTCCKILGVQPGADPEVIKSAFRKSAKELHPDRNSSEKAQEYFILVKNAYQYLIDHPYSKEEIAYMEQLARTNSDDAKVPYRHKTTSPIFRRQSITLRQALKQSLTARILFFFFHIIFLIIGVYLIVKPIHDAIFYSVDERIPLIPAYFTLLVGLFFGILITVIFLFSGYSYLRNR
jgi:hypothetical protein